MKIEGKVCIVTGGTGGLGKQFCRQLLAKGAKVCFGDISDKDGQKDASQYNKEFGKGSAVYVRCDVTKQTDIDGIFKCALKEFGRIDIVIPNAGLVNEVKWEHCVDVNLNGVIRCILTAVRYMGKDKGGNGGVVINVASIAGIESDTYPFFPVYSGTKNAVIGLTRAWSHALHYQRTGVRFNALCPELTDTPILDTFSPDTMYFFEHVDKTKLLKASEVGQSVIPIIEDDSANGVVTKVLYEGGAVQHTF